MATAGGANTVVDGLVLSLDAANLKSYPGSGTVWNDLSGNLNSGSLVNGPTFDSGNGGSIVLDGANDYINIPHDSSITPTSVTIDFWFKTDDINQASQALVSKRTSFSSGAYWTYLTNKTFYFDTYENEIQNRFTSIYNPLTSNTWYNVTFTYGANGKFIYVNRAVIGSTGYGGPLTSTNVRLDIGNSDNSGNSYPLNGQISNVKIYNRQLSFIEILQNYNATKSRFSL